MVSSWILLLVSIGYAALLFGALLVGRRLRGWRGRTALRWTLAACAAPPTGIWTNTAKPGKLAG